MDLTWIFDILKSPWLSLFFLSLIGYHCWQHVYDYNDLDDCLACMGANEATIFISNPQNINENLTVPANITLRFIRGGTLNVGKFSIRNATYKWTSSPAAVNEFYLTTAAGADPGLPEPPDVFEDGAVMRKAALGSLVVGEWNFGDNDALGFNTIYVRLSGGTTDNTGDTTNGSPIITGMTSTSDFFVGDHVTVSAGFPAGVHEIIAKTATSITLDINATSTEADVTVTTFDPDAKAEDYVEAAYKVIIEGSVEAGQYQIFEGPGSVIFSGTRVGNGLLKDIYPHWRGFNPLEALDVRGGIKLRDRDPQAVVTFTIDDGNAITDWPALFTSKGVTATAFPQTDVIADTAPWLALQTAGWEIGSHTKTHPYLSTLTEEQIEDEVGGSKTLLESWGFKVRNLVYPYHDDNALVRKIARKYYLGACGTGLDEPNIRPFVMADLIRVDGDNDTIGELQGYVDDTFSLEGWLIVILHAADAPKLTKIGDLIDYIQGLGIQILTLSEAEDLIGNLVSAPDFEIGARGEIQGSQMAWRAALPTKGRSWKQGDVIWNTESVAGGSPGWVCTTSGTFGDAGDATGDTVNGSPIITGMTDTHDFDIASYVTITAGFPAGIHKIIAKTATSITLDINATSTEADVTVWTQDPVFKAMANLAA